MESHNLQALRSQLDATQVIRLAKRLNRARRIMVVGVDFAASLSYLLAYGLASLGYDAEAPIGSTGNLQQKVNLLGPIRLRVDYRIFKLGSGALYSPAHRVYAGINLKF